MKIKAKQLKKIAKAQINKDYRKKVLTEYKAFIKAIKIRAKQGHYSFDYTIEFNSYKGWDRYLAYRLLRLKHRDLSFRTKYKGFENVLNCLTDTDYVNYHRAERVLISINWE